ncbi:MAG: general secretion pathway protein GspB [Pseudomonadota bacterium]|nr:general secretion pathway protein GspB [Pseudomonadota bacterium]
MSYILDALKKAESERHLGELPGLHTQPAVPIPAPAAKPSWQRPGVWAGAAAILVVLVLIGWQWSERVVQAGPRLTGPVAAPAVSPPIAELAANTTANAVPPVSESMSNRQRSAVVGAAAVPAGTLADLPVPPPLPKAPPVAMVAASAVPVPAAAAKIASAARAQQATADRRVATSPPPAAALPKSASAAPIGSAATPVDFSRVPTLAQLPDALQHELPPLAVGGSMYSDNPADRMLLIDKRLFHEGDEVAPGVVIETLLPKAAVLRYKGNRFRLVF